MKTQERLKIAVQKSGRLYQSSMDFLTSRGLSFSADSRSLIRTCQNSNIDIVYLRDDDIPEYVSRGIADFGIVGQNVLAEKGLTLRIVTRLNFGLCRLVIAVPRCSRIRTVEDLQNLRIATSYPKVLTDYLEKRNIKTSIVVVAGSAEIAPRLGLADAVCDLVQTGATLEANDLVPLCTVLGSQAVLVGSPVRKRSKKRLLLDLNINSLI